MRYNFDEPIDRRGTYSRKWSLEGMYEMADYADEKSIPMWVADMDFKAPNIVTEKLLERVKHGVFGYSMDDSNYFQAINYWNSKRRGFQLEKDWLLTLNGVVTALNLAVRSLTLPGEGIIIQTPVYPQFRHCILNNGRTLVDNRLLDIDGTYHINFPELEELAKNPKNTLMIICNPHNPVGRVWTEEELKKISDICANNGVTLISDEIHSDLILFQNRFTSLGTLGEKALKNTIICTSMSKSFNLAALKTAHIVIPDSSKRDKMVSELLTWGEKPFPNLFGIVATEAAYSPEGEEWLNQLIEYLEKNYLFMKEFLKKNLPAVELRELQSTYLAWIDLRGLNFPEEIIKHKLEKEAKVVIDGGEIFGDSGKGFIRLNFACPRALLQESLERIASALKN
ncbi:MAG: MalY/PatB family protein [Fusobacteriaceae bacterium]